MDTGGGWDQKAASGTTVTEVRNLVGMRTDGPGMRWSQQRAEYVIHLRCILLNGQWTDFESSLVKKRVTLKGKPQQGTPHDAVRKAAQVLIASMKSWICALHESGGEDSTTDSR
jgi:hypothetical protein